MPMPVSVSLVFPCLQLWRAASLTRWVYTWLMFAILFASTSQGISYPYLYRNSAASPRARLTEALASAIEPVMTHPTDGESLKTWDTDDGSISLSYALRQQPAI